MRVTEKSFELTICSHISLALWNAGWASIWFGLSQRQEAALGFDVASRVGELLLLLQLKASNRVGNAGRLFVLPSREMHALLRMAGHRRRMVYYVLPDTGTSLELSQRVSRLLDYVWMLDVTELVQQRQRLLPPTSTARYHRLYLRPPHAELRSDVLRLTVHPATAVVSELEARLQAPPTIEGGAQPGLRSLRDDVLAEVGRYPGRKALGLVLWRRG